MYVLWKMKGVSAVQTLSRLNRICPPFEKKTKIKATNFVQKKAEEHTKSDLVAKPVIKLPMAENFGLAEAKEERLSQIIAETNSRTGKASNIQESEKRIGGLSHV